MAKNKNKLRKSEVAKHGNIHSYKLITGRKPSSSIKMEVITAILLGVTMLLSAWAAWISSLHSGNQSINFTKSNNIASEGTAEYNIGMQLYLSDYMAWNVAKEYYYELEAAKADGDQTRTELITEKIESFKDQNVSVILADGVNWMEENNEDNPFKTPGMTEKYFESAQEKMDRSQDLLK